MTLMASLIRCMRSAENPKATRQFHPLTVSVFERPKHEGGLGMAKFSVSYANGF